MWKNILHRLIYTVDNLTPIRDLALYPTLGPLSGTRSFTRVVVRDQVLGQGLVIGALSDDMP